jgi:hypothetical protein
MRLVVRLMIRPQCPTECVFVTLKLTKYINYANVVSDRVIRVVRCSQ